ncbi:TonB-dependent receptor [Pseudobacteriovorax antillogorgiicola]|uniref:TonB-dependent Receptor Plug Domain n=1 Tax=Pseudobacteriovorax antillogorgiicola TaxID=1513793 RepID=A0A1Y6BII9_9BACT|nr:TonB-dependent receptor [Pseudobacteriovorax antillogorgiicola]TCS56485.1 TonB-dependent receptor-like protein [Pseudobacteriovorax antillogorgiicola]SMF04897.1 TonB-dependent Receptor Plug Domain [Pseudobacteriovorax antillogorgiicola]
MLAFLSAGQRSARLRLLKILVPLAFLLGVSDAFAQVTNARFRGTVIDASGSPVAGAQVTMSHDKGLVKKTTETNASGVFVFTGLKVGGPYTLTTVSSGAEPIKNEGISLAAGNNPPFEVAIGGGSGEVETITVTGGRVAPKMSGNVYDAGDIETAPTAQGDLKDVIRFAPDVYLEGDRLYLGGANNRFNSVTIDGIRQDDDFGLNNNGYPSLRSPIPLGAAEEIAVNRSPFDVRYGNFIGGNINVVTKSGSNDLEAGINVVHTNDRWQGQKTKDTDVSSEFEENRVGIHVGGPIIEDKLFYFFAAEALTQTSPNYNGVAGSGASNEASDISAADVARVQDISSRIYGFNAGKVSQSNKAEDLKFLVKFDYEINDSHRLEAKYQSVDGTSVEDGTARSNYLPLTSNWYENKQSLSTVSLRLFSDWDHALSTKVELSTKTTKSNPTPLEGDGFAQMTVALEDGGPEIVLGPDPFRQANELETNTLHFGTEANYLLGSHLITGGIDLDTVDVYNLFGPFSSGTAEFDTIDDFEAQEPSNLYYQNALSNNVDDVAADWGYNVTTIYLQDEYQITPQLTARFGLRTELYSSKGDINYNANFEQRYGFDNRADLDGKQLFLPRAGLSYQAAKRLTFTGGLGIYAGGTPNVWLSNNYSNDGVNIDDVSASSASGFDGRTIPDDLKNQLTAGDGNVDALDPDFELPRNLKFALGAKYGFDLDMLGDFGENWFLESSYTYDQVQQALLWKDLRRDNSQFDNNTANAVAPDGRQIYDTDLDTESGTDFNTRRGYDLLLTNTDKGFSHNLNLTLSKTFMSGFSFSGSYNWQRSEDVNPGNSSRSVSNYGQVAIGTNPNDPGLATSNYERQHRFVFRFGYEQNFLMDLMTSVNLFFERRSGQPFSYTFGGDRDRLGALFGEEREFARRERMLFYVPKGDGSDVILDGIDEAAFNAYLARTGLDEYRGEIAPRNAFKGDWVDNIDLKISQELPGYGDGKAGIALNIQNLPNFLNNKWGQQKNPNFPFTVPVVDVAYDTASGRYIYSDLDENGNDNIEEIRSIWRMQLTAFYRF